MREEKVKGSENRTLVRKRGIRARAWRDKSGLHSEERQRKGKQRRRGRASKESLPRKVEGNTSG